MSDEECIVPCPHCGSALTEGEAKRLERGTTHEPSQLLQATHDAWQGALVVNRRLKRQMLWCVALLLVNAVVLVWIATRSSAP